MAAGAAALAAVARSRFERERSEEKVARELYSRFFKADLFEHSPDKPSSVSEHLPAALDANAASAIRAIERYQKERRHWFLWMSSSAEQVGDTRTRVLEELKQWLLRISDASSISAVEVSDRLDYSCQFLLRPSVFEVQNATSFLGTIAEVCRQLELMLKKAVANQRRGEEQIGSILNMARELALETLPVLLHSALELKGGAGEDLSEQRQLSGPSLFLLATGEDLREGAEAGSSSSSRPAGAKRAPDWQSDAGKLLKALLVLDHVFRLAAPSAETEVANPAASPGSPSTRFIGLLQELRTKWAAGQLDQGSGLVDTFRAADQVEVRTAFLELCEQLDRLCFFLCALRPFHQLANIAGDVSLCWLKRSLGHLLQELEKSLEHQRQARLRLMRAAKRRLRDLARRLPELSPQERRWMQDLRFVQELRLEELHKSILSLCADVRSAASASREVEIESAARAALRDIVDTFSSGNFQARISLAMPEGLMNDLRHSLGDASRMGVQALTAG